MIFRFCVFVSIQFLCSVLAFADEVEQRLIARMADMFPGEKVTEISRSPITGLYEVMVSGGVFYLSADARYIVHGDLIDLDKRQNLSSRRREIARKDTFAGLEPKDFVEFAAPANATKKILYVFTDIDCGYCRKLHNEMAELNSGGISVRYLAFPREGLKGKSFDKAVAVWCSADRRQAMNQAKRGEAVVSPKCDNPVAREFELGQTIGVNGTPAVYTDAGRQLGGYVPAKELLRMLAAGEI
jgi:thiol:disulfide interchange protein DsbC